MICISKSGNTPEIKVLVRAKMQGFKLLLVSSNTVHTWLNRQISYSTPPLMRKLAPITWRPPPVPLIWLGRCLGGKLLELRNFTPDFAQYHPGGSWASNWQQVSDVVAGNATCGKASSRKEAIVKFHRTD